jgi:hypothetical protein
VRRILEWRQRKIKDTLRGKSGFWKKTAGAAVAGRLPLFFSLHFREENRRNPSTVYLFDFLAFFFPFFFAFFFAICFTSFQFTKRSMFAKKTLALLNRALRIMQALSQQFVDNLCRDNLVFLSRVS